MTGRTLPLDLVPGLRSLAQAQHGVVRRDQLRELGVTYQHVRSQVAAQRWMAFGPRAVVLSTGVLTRQQRRAVGVAHAGPRSALAGLTALEDLGLRGWEREPVHVLVPHGLKPPPLRGIVVHQTHHLDADDLLPSRWPLSTNAARSAVDSASWERSPRTASGLVLAVVQQRLATAYEILGVLELSGPVRHRALLRSVLADSADGADSLAEIDVARLVRSVGLGEPERQMVVETPEGRRRVDLGVRLPDGRILGIEIDGPHHSDPHVREADAAKDAALLAAGCFVLHIPVSLLRRGPSTVRAQLQAIADAARRGA